MHRKKPLTPRPPKPPPLTPLQRLWGMRMMLDNACKQLLYLEQELADPESKAMHATIALNATKRALESIEVTLPVLRKIAKEREYGVKEG